MCLRVPPPATVAFIARRFGGTGGAPRLCQACENQRSSRSIVVEPMMSLLQTPRVAQ